MCLSHLQGDSGGLSGHGAIKLLVEKELKRIDSAEGGERPSPGAAGLGKISKLTT